MRYKYYLLSLLILGTIACAPYPHAILYPRIPHFPPTDPRSIQLLRHEPHASHIKLGEVRFTPTPDMSPYYVERVLREKAAQIGADGLVIVVDRFFRQAVVHGYYFPHVDTYAERVIIGVAIKYQPM